MQIAAQLLPRQALQKPQKKRASEVIITKRYEEVLQAVHQLRFVTAMDLTRLFYTPTSINHVREILSKMSGKRDYAERQYLYRFPLPNTRIGNTEKIYTLGSQGRAYLQTQGMSVDWYFRPYKVAGMTYQNCLHALTLTRFLVAAMNFCKRTQGWELVKMRTEYELKKEIGEEQAKQTLVMVALKKDSGTEVEQVKVIPDAWLLFHHQSKKKGSWQPVFLEIDRASEQSKFFKRLVKARVLFLTNGGYKKLFGTNKGVIAYATTGNASRLKSMREWTKEVLSELHMKRIAPRFRFCSLSPSWETKEESLFLSPMWYTASDKNPVALLR